MEIKKWSSPEIENRIKKITKILESQGFECRREEAGECIEFGRPGDYKKFYQGTYLNIFSKHEDVKLYDTKWMLEYKFIKIKEVYRSNGTEHNVSLDLLSGYTGCKNLNYFNYDGVRTPTWQLDFDVKKVKRFRPDISDKVQERMLSHAIDIYDSLELKDWSKEELNPANFPEDTVEEYYEYMNKKRAK